MDQIIERIKTWADQTDDVLGIVLVGSQTRIDKPADEWSDFDLILIVEDPEKYVMNSSWLSAIGEVKLTHIERTIFGDIERRVLFNSGVAVDFVPISNEFISSIKNKTLSSETLVVFSRGYQVLIDKIGFSEYLPPVISIIWQCFARQAQQGFGLALNLVLIFCDVYRFSLSGSMSWIFVA